MSREPSTHDTLEVPYMEHTKAAELIRQLKEIKKANEITYPRIIERME